MSKCAGNIPEFDDLEDPDEAERAPRIRRPRNRGKRKHPVRAAARRGLALGCG